MGIGPLARRALGRHERWISEAYRRLFVDLNALVASVREHVKAPEAILELGCGDGMVTQRLALAFPCARVTGIDVCAQPGRLYRGERSRVRFLRTTAEELAATEDLRYQLVIIADVLHHVPHPEWSRFLSSAAALVSEGGTLILKDWVREWTPAYLIGYLSDRFITGDRIRYPHEHAVRSLVKRTCGETSIRSEFRVSPWHCNLALVISPPPIPQLQRDTARDAARSGA